ncbi:hypothetical protein PROFUN_10281 [Planoprotostelium fungivorum]|uniref:DNA repair protein n=1 Tax=Planoprotostelium fungivorum TaxID=1890364 RepID=A0A2P6MRR7_9EUKA|nr:hypothetical protein PROFUN_10281 [Planoprotostelium fungivorum]
MSGRRWNRNAAEGGSRGTKRKKGQGLSLGLPAASEIPLLPADENEEPDENQEIDRDMISSFTGSTLSKAKKNRITNQFLTQLNQQKADKEAKQVKRKPLIEKKQINGEAPLPHQRRRTVPIPFLVDQELDLQVDEEEEADKRKRLEENRKADEENARRQRELFNESQMEEIVEEEVEKEVEVEEKDGAESVSLQTVQNSFTFLDPVENEARKQAKRGKPKKKTPSKTTKPRKTRETPSRRREFEEKIKSMTEEEAIELAKNYVDQGNEPTTKMEKPRKKRKSQGMMDEFEDEEEPVQRQAEEEWEDIQITTNHAAAPLQVCTNGDININLRRNVKEEKKVKKKGITKEDREDIAELHKAHLVTLIAHVTWVNKQIDDEEVKGLMLSTVPQELVWEGQSDLVDRSLVRSVVQHFRSQFRVVQFEKEKKPSNRNPLLRVIKRKSATPIQAVQLVAALFRSIGINVRYCVAIDPVPIKATVKTTVHIKQLKEAPIDCDFDPVANGATNHQDPIRKVWIEFYSTTENRWSTLDLFNKKSADKLVHDDPRALIDPRRPFGYVFAIEHDYIKDITRRYSLRWSVTKQFRVFEERWLFHIFRRLSSKAFKNRGPEFKRREMEDERSLMLCEEIEEFPTSAEGFRRHPTYTLEKFITKYQMLMPDAQPVGEFKEMAVYKREDVKELHSMDKWLQEGRVVKEGEEPLKKVPKKKQREEEKPQKIPAPPQERELVNINGQEFTAEEIDMAMEQARIQNEEESAPLTSLYGLWQTLPYEPQVASDGVVPRNRYGNVYLFKPDMCPIGCVHIRKPGLGKICKTLGIDYAPAMVAWETKMGRSVPLLDGYVVCEEQSEILVEAWEQNEQRVREERQKKKEKLVYGRWKRILIKMITRARVDEKYGEREDNGLIHGTNVEEKKEKTKKTKKGGPHEHEFEEVMIDGEKGVYENRCTCGLKIRFEKL